MDEARFDREQLLRLGAGGAVGLAFLTGAGRALAAGPPSKPTGTLHAANPGEPNFIDPSQALEITEWSIVRNVYDGLLQWDRNYKHLVPALATSWRSNPRATVWTFNLRRGVKFHDGTPFDSTAARKTIEYYKGKTWGLIFANIVKIDDSRPNVLELTFSAPSPDLARNQTVAKMISPKLIDAKAVGKQAIGTGAYRFKQWNRGTSVILEPNADYWGKAGPYLNEIELRNIADKTAAITALTAGDVDVVFKVPPKQLQTLEQNSKLARSSSRPSWIEGHLVFRCDQKPVSDVRVRRAIAYAIERKALVDKVFLGQATVANTPLPPGTYGQTNPPTHYPYDPDKAKALLKQAGYPKGIDVGMVVFAGIRVLGEEVGQAIEGQLQAAGINAKLDILEPGVAIKDLLAKKPQHQIFHAEYGYANGGPFHFTIGTALGHPMYKGAALEALMKQVSTTPDGPARLRVLARAQDLFMKELPHLPLYHLVLTDVFTKKLHNYRSPVDGYLPVFTSAYLA